MMDWASISNRPAVHKVTTPLKVSTVSSVMLQNIGTPSLKGVSPAKLDILGTTSLMNARAVNSQEPSIKTNVFVPNLKPSGIMMLRLALVQPTASEINAFHALPQDNGTSKTTHASAQHQQPNGTEPIALAQLEDTGQAALNAQLQGIGTTKPTNVSAILHSYGTDKTVFAQHLTSCTREDAQSVQMDTNGKRTDARNANAHSRI